MQILPVGIHIQRLVAVDAQTTVSLSRKQDSGEVGQRTGTFWALWALVHDSIGSWGVRSPHGRKETETEVTAALKTNGPHPNFAQGYFS